MAFLVSPFPSFRSAEPLREDDFDRGKGDHDKEQRPPEF
jgi:hypothetical protein